MVSFLILIGFQKLIFTQQKNGRFISDTKITLIGNGKTREKGGITGEGVFQFKRQRQILRKTKFKFQRVRDLPYELEPLEITPHSFI